MSSKYIYILINDGNHPFYVGATKIPKTRESQHRKRFNHFTIKLITGLIEEWVEVERATIAEYEAKGLKLKNISEAGQNKYFCNYKSRRK